MANVTIIFKNIWLNDANNIIVDIQTYFFLPEGFLNTS